MASIRSIEAVDDDEDLVYGSSICIAWHWKGLCWAWINFHRTRMVAVILCLFLSLPLLLFLVRQERRKRSRLPPGPWRLPVVGNLHQVGKNPHLTLRALAERHGPLMFLQLGSIPTVVISSAHVAREVFRAHDLAFAGRPTLYAAERLSYGLRDVAFAPHGEHWRQARKVFVVELLSAKRVRSFRGVREREVASLVASIRRLAPSSSSSPIDLSRMVVSVTNAVTCRAAFGGGCETAGSGRLRWVMDELQSVLGGVLRRGLLPVVAVDSCVGRAPGKGGEPSDRGAPQRRLHIGPRRLGAGTASAARGSNAEEHLRQYGSHQGSSHGHIYRRHGHVCGDHHMDGDGAAEGPE
ncbi:cytochrome P450 [Musa troglodytarum]|uniref:Cytochrome P450 n=1 Tax=Musa troglodytarum TaxID=320322 RepID=A0A9E7HJ35_9LILI|nr:cytochrome P450 [Musa troglodytarum]